jgi:hypothetical protein
MNPQLTAMAGGGLLLVLIIVNILIGTKVIKASLKVHVSIAWVILALGVLHAAGGILKYFGWMPR